MYRIIRFFFADPFRLKIKTKSLEEITLAMQPSLEEQDDKPDEFAQIMRGIIEKISEGENTVSEVE